MADPKYAALPGIVSSYDAIMHTFWFIGNDFYYRLKLRIKYATSPVSLKKLINYLDIG